MFELIFTETATQTLEKLQKNSAKQGLVKQIKQSLGFLQTNPKHPSMHSHPYGAITNPLDPDAKVFEAYAQNNTPGAYRIFWSYGPQKTQITLIAITPHP